MRPLSTNMIRSNIGANRGRRGELVPLVAVACVMCYVLRHSLVPKVFNHPYVEYLGPPTIVMILIAAAYVAGAGVGKLSKSALLVIAATALSLVHCERIAFALPRWLGWVVLVIALGPANSTATARYLRSRMLTAMNAAFVAITFLSSLWWAAGMPNLGRGDFTGVMAHSMVLGPIAGYVAVLSVVRLFSRGSLLWIVPYGNAWLVAMLASSRAALAAAAIGTLVVIAVNFKRNLVLAGSLVAAALAVAVAPNGAIGLVTQVLPGSITGGLANKSWNHSREQHWNARWEEFVSSPLTGVGFAAAWEDSVGVDEETGTVETGSSYISILSMTGCIGAAAWLVLVASIAAQVVRRWRDLTGRDRLAVCGMASFWLVHLGAEGYIYAVGSLIGVTFWLWLGCLNDSLCVERRRPALLRLAPGTVAARPRRRSALAAAPVRPMK
jgi:O-antigen ligase